eukprot:6215254-Karenia_brevis.AAC.1
MLLHNDPHVRYVTFVTGQPKIINTHRQMQPQLRVLIPAFPATQLLSSVLDEDVMIMLLPIQAR